MTLCFECCWFYSAFLCCRNCNSTCCCCIALFLLFFLWTEIKINNNLVVFIKTTWKKMKTNRETHFVAWPILIRKLSRNYGLAADTLVYGAISPYISVFAWAHSRSPMPIARVRILFHFFFVIICCSCNCCLRVRFTRAPAFYDTLSFSHRNFSTNTHFVRIVSNNLFMCIFGYIECMSCTCAFTSFQMFTVHSIRLCPSMPFLPRSFCLILFARLRCYFVQCSVIW